MGWTFEEYDRTPAKDINGLLELWRVQNQKGVGSVDGGLTA